MREQDWSISDADLLASVRALLDSDKRAVVATIVDVEGSAYRRPGAKMIIEEEGGGIGHITAGCLEDEVSELATEIFETAEPQIKTYDLIEDDDVWGLGVGCNGIIDVLLEPLDTNYKPLVEAFEAEKPIGAVTVINGDPPPGAKAYYRENEDDLVTSESDEFPQWLADAVANAAATLVEEGKADTLSVQTDVGKATVFVDAIRPPPRLTVFGSGHDVEPVVELAKQTGFRVTVIGFRGAVELVARFPKADEHISTSPANLRETVSLGETTYAVVMTHNFVDDRLALEELAESDVPYVGLMGPRKRYEEMMEAFEAEGRHFTEEELESIYTPIGLNLGDGSPYGIAISIVAEVLAVHNGREPKHLTDREGPIHDRSEIETPSTD
jgi:xanthine dehydrogenase accessory factor